MTQGYVYDQGKARLAPNQARYYAVDCGSDGPRPLNEAVLSDLSRVRTGIPHRSKLHAEGTNRSQGYIVVGYGQSG